MSINLARRLLKGSLAFLAVRVDGVTAHSTGTNGNATTGIAVDSGGNFLIGGYSQPSAVLPGFVAKIPASMSATPTWQRKQSMATRFGLLNEQSIGLDASDNVYAFGQGYVASPDLLHLFKYNSAGTLQWQRKLTSANTCNGSGLAVTTGGDSYIAATDNPATPFGVMAKYNSSGTLQGQRKLSGTYRVAFANCTLVAAGGFAICGEMYDGGSAASNSRGILVKYDTTPAIVWQKKIHFSEEGVWNAVAEDSAAGDFVLGGYTNASVYGTLLKIDSAAATVAWHKKHPTANTLISCVAVDPATGYVYFAYIASSSGLVVGCLDATGTPVWLRHFVGDGGTVAQAKAMLVSGNHLLLAGQFSRTGQGADAALLRIPKGTGGRTGAVGWITSSEPSAISWGTGTPVVANAGLTDAAGTHTDAAGSATDAAETLTFTAVSS